MTAADAAKRVAMGAALLDEKRPGWAERIRLDDFQLDVACACVLGQLEGSYTRAVRTLFPGQCEQGMAKARLHGFNGTGGHPRYQSQVCLLQAAWIDAITERLTPPVAWTHREPRVTQKATS